MGRADRSIELTAQGRNVATPSGDGFDVRADVPGTDIAEIVGLVAVADEHGVLSILDVDVLPTATFRWSKVLPSISGAIEAIRRC